jgi:mRNA interferase RelE/StbE
VKTIVFTVAAAKQFDDLAADAREQVGQALDRYAVSGTGDVKRLSARAGYRLRVGRHRVLFDEDQQTILAVYVGKRETTTYSRS